MHMCVREKEREQKKTIQSAICKCLKAKRIWFTEQFKCVQYSVMYKSTLFLDLFFSLVTIYIFSGYDLLVRYNMQNIWENYIVVYLFYIINLFVISSFVDSVHFV